MCRLAIGPVERSDGTPLTCRKAIRQILAGSLQVHGLQFVIHFLGLGWVLFGELGHFLGQLFTLEGGFVRRASSPGGQGAGEGGCEGEFQEGFHGWASYSLLGR
jgi:hypothetical protein